MNFVQITDLHIGHPPHQHGIDPCANLDRIVDTINMLALQPDFVLVTGDLVADETVESYELLNQHLDRLETPYFLLPGNHDDRDMIRAQWPRHDYLQTVSDHLQYAVEMDDFLLIALDTQLTGEVNGTLCDDRLDWLEQQIAGTGNKPVILAQHHPLNAWAKEPHADCRPRFAEILRAHGNIAAILCGHLHRAMTLSFAEVPVLVAPSTAYTFFYPPVPDVPLLVTDEPPGYAIHYWTRHGLESHAIHVTNP